MSFLKRFLPNKYVATVITFQRNKPSITKETYNNLESAVKVYRKMIAMKYREPLIDREIVDGHVFMFNDLIKLGDIIELSNTKSGILKFTVLVVINKK